MVQATMAAPRFRMLLISSFAGLALLVALIGVYGVMAFVTMRRTREIGIRMALGATAHGVRSQILRSGGALLLVGLAVGIGAGLLASRSLASMLYGVSTSDPSTDLVAVLLVAVTGVAACYLPARRASRIEPVIALRDE